MSSASTDIIVVVPGIMGSTLCCDGREFWGISPSTIARGLRRLPNVLERLRLPEGIGDDHPNDGVTPGRLMPEIHSVPGIWNTTVGYDRLVRMLRTECKLRDGENLLIFPYDWRLSNRYNARRLRSEVEPMLHLRRRTHPGAKIVFVCHSMGGLIARWFLLAGDPRDVRSIITIGTPHRGAASALQRLLDGVGGKFGSRLGLPSIARTLPSLHQLLPEYACVDDAGALLKTTEVDLPHLDQRMVTDGMRFHDELNKTPSDAMATHAIVGIAQPTLTTFEASGGALTELFTIAGTDERGDGTVPRLSGRPKGEHEQSGAHYVVGKHGALSSSRAVLTQIQGILTERWVEHRAADPTTMIGVEVEDLVASGQPVAVLAVCTDVQALLEARVVSAAPGPQAATFILTPAADPTLRFGETEALVPGGYLVQVRRRGAATWTFDAVTAPVLAV
jgi:pimeloyl-ACP methyl ester carboxylesterase